MVGSNRVDFDPAAISLSEAVSNRRSFYSCASTPKPAAGTFAGQPCPSESRQKNFWLAAKLKCEV